MDFDEKEIGLSKTQMVNIVKEYKTAAPKATYEALAEKYKVTASNIEDVVRNESYILQTCGGGKKRKGKKPRALNGRNILTLAERLKVIEEYTTKNPKPSFNSLAIKYQVSSGQITNILLHQEAIMETSELARETTYGSVDPKVMEQEQRKDKINFLGKAMYEYLQRVTYHGIEITFDAVMLKAKEISECIAINKFRPTYSWATDFKLKYGVSRFYLSSLRRHIKVTDVKSKRLDTLDLVRYARQQESEERLKRLHDRQKHIPKDQPNESENDVAPLPSNTSCTKSTGKSCINGKILSGWPSPESGERHIVLDTSRDDEQSLQSAITAPERKLPNGEDVVPFYMPCDDSEFMEKHISKSLTTSDGVQSRPPTHNAIESLGVSDDEPSLGDIGINSECIEEKPQISEPAYMYPKMRESTESIRDKHMNIPKDQPNESPIHSRVNLSSNPLFSTAPSNPLIDTRKLPEAPSQNLQCNQVSQGKKSAVAHSENKLPPGEEVVAVYMSCDDPEFQKRYVSKSLTTCEEGSLAPSNAIEPLAVRQESPIEANGIFSECIEEKYQISEPAYANTIGSPDQSEKPKEYLATAIKLEPVTDDYDAYTGGCIEVDPQMYQSSLQYPKISGEPTQNADSLILPEIKQEPAMDDIDAFSEFIEEDPQVTTMSPTSYHQMSDFRKQFKNFDSVHATSFIKLEPVSHDIDSYNEFIEEHAPNSLSPFGFAKISSTCEQFANQEDPLKPAMEDFDVFSEFIEEDPQHSMTSPNYFNTVDGNILSHVDIDSGRAQNIDEPSTLTIKQEPATEESELKLEFTEEKPQISQMPPIMSIKKEDMICPLPALATKGDVMKSISLLKRFALIRNCNEALELLESLNETLT